MAYIYATIGNKGGPGKTSEALGLAYALASMGRNVAVVDMDAQGNATRRLAIDKASLIDADRPGIAEVLDPRRPAHIADAAVPCGWDDPVAQRITVVPCLDRETMAERSEEAGKPGASTRLARALDRDGWSDPFHDVIIDTGPDVNHLLQNTLTAADMALLVLTLDHDAIEGALYLARYIDTNRDAFGNAKLRIGGIAVNAADERGSARQRGHAANLPATFAQWGGADLIWQPFVPFRQTLANAHDAALPVSEFRHPAVKELVDTYEQHAKRLIATQEG